MRVVRPDGDVRKKVAKVAAVDMENMKHGTQHLQPYAYTFLFCLHNVAEKYQNTDSHVPPSFLLPPLVLLLADFE